MWPISTAVRSEKWSSNQHTSICIVSSVRRALNDRSASWALAAAGVEVPARRWAASASSHRSSIQDCPDGERTSNGYLPRRGRSCRFPQPFLMASWVNRQRVMFPDRSSASKPKRARTALVVFLPTPFDLPYSVTVIQFPSETCSRSPVERFRTSARYSTLSPLHPW